MQKGWESSNVPSLSPKRRRALWAAASSAESRMPTARLGCPRSSSGARASRQLQAPTSAQHLQLPAVLACAAGPGTEQALADINIAASLNSMIPFLPGLMERQQQNLLHLSRQLVTQEGLEPPRASLSNLRPTCGPTQIVNFLKAFYFILFCVILCFPTLSCP